MQDVHEQLSQARAEHAAIVAKMNSGQGRAKVILSRCTSEKRDLTPAEQTQIDRLCDSQDSFEAEALQIMARIDELEATPKGRSAGPNNMGGATGARNVQPRPLVGTDRTWGGMFGNRLADRPDNQFNSLGDFARAVVSGNDARLIRNASGYPSTASEGVSAGYMVPTAFTQMLMDASLLQEVFRPRANVVPVTSGNAVISGFSTQDRTGNKRAGLVLYWDENDGAELTRQKPKARQFNVSATKGSIFCSVSNELLDDAPNFDQELGRAMVAALSAGLDYAFLSGTGAGQPLGFINGPSTIVVSKESGQAANTILLQNLMKMVARLTPESYPRSVWFAHVTTLPQLYGMAYTVKNAAGTDNVGGSLVQPITVGPDGGLRIFGLPVIITDAVQPLSSQGDLVLCDPVRYTIALRQDVRLMRDASQYFDSDTVAFRLTIRLDGSPEDPGPTTLRDGSSTVGPCVVLQAR